VVFGSPVWIELDWLATPGLAMMKDKHHTVENQCEEKKKPLEVAVFSRDMDNDAERSVLSLRSLASGPWQM
jgi:hypothetical protein